MFDSLIMILVALFTLASAFCLYWLLGQRGIAMFMEYREMFTNSARANLSDSVMVADTGRLFYANVVAMVVVPLLVWVIVGDWMIALVLFGLLAALPQYAYRRMRKKRMKKFEIQLPDALSMMSGSLKAGASLSIAIDSMVMEMPDPISQEFELFRREQKLGADFETAMKHMEHRIPVIDFQLVVSALRISREVGGNLTEVMESMADTLRKKAMMEGKIQSLTAQGTMQGYVMACLPIGIGAILMFMEPVHMGKLFNTDIGYMTLGVIVVMEFLGFMTIRKITSIDV
ncbi:MAG: type II secretion system F family protein [Gammaproteobacteria bacterium]|nr:MAG: type II secretion system F family protein [Gammaproteobacteria bacterium]